MFETLSDIKRKQNSIFNSSHHKLASSTKLNPSD